MVASAAAVIDDPDTRHDTSAPPPTQQPAAAAAAAPAAAPPHIHPVTLAIAPRSLERKFWREVGTPGYANLDRLALGVTFLNLIVIYWVMRFRHHTGAGPAEDALSMLKACPRGVVLGVHCLHVLGVVGSVASLGLLVAAPAAYNRVRMPLIAAHRIGRACNCLVSP